MNRVKSLLCRSPYQPGSSKFSDSTESFLRKVGLVNGGIPTESKPSSATTACTYAPNEFSTVLKSDELSKSASKKKRDAKKDTKKNSNSKNPVGAKRPGQIRLGKFDLSYFSFCHYYLPF